MTLTNTIDYRGVRGDRKYHRGTYTNDSTGGDIDTGMGYVEFMQLIPTGATKSATSSTINETPIVAGAAVTIVTPSGEVGTWEAVGW